MFPDKNPDKQSSVLSPDKVYPSLQDKDTKFRWVMLMEDRRPCAGTTNPRQSEKLKSLF